MTQRRTRSVRRAERQVEGVWIEEGFAWTAFDANGEPRLVTVDAEGRVRTDAEVNVDNLTVNVDAVRLRDGNDPDLTATVDASGRLAASVAGTVDVGNLPTTYPDQHDQPLTDAQLRATSVPVDTGLTIPEPQTDALTDAELRAAAVEVDTGLTQPATAADLQTDALTDEQLRAAPVGTSDGQAHALLDAVRQQTEQPASAAFAAGRLFVSGIRLSLSANNRGVWQLLNPADSGVVMFVIAIDLYVDVNTRIRFRRLDAPIDGAAVDPFSLNQANPAVSLGEFRAENRGSSDPPGDSIPIEARATASAPYRFQGAIAIPPGQGYLAWVQAPGGLTGSADVAASATWYGQDI